MSDRAGDSDLAAHVCTDTLRYTLRYIRWRDGVLQQAHPGGYETYAELNGFDAYISHAIVKVGQQRWWAVVALNRDDAATIPDAVVARCRTLTAARMVCQLLPEEPWPL